MPEELDALIAGRYQLGRSLGVGGMAEVFEATDLRTGQQVAIKCLLPQHAAEPQLARRFLSEATRTQSLSRPYILKVLDSGQAAGAPFVIFELAQGGSLEDWLDDLQQALPPAVVIRLAHALASALEHAHAQGIIHQDLKPSNILFRCLPDPEQEEFDVALADFGQARTVALASMTGSSLMWG